MANRPPSKWVAVRHRRPPVRPPPPPLVRPPLHSNLTFQFPKYPTCQLSITTRPDIAFAVQSASQHTSTPRVVHWEAVKRIFRYLKVTMDLGLTLGGRT